MKIALFTDTYLPQKNGVAVAVNQLKHELTKLGHEVYVYTIHIPQDEAEIEEQVMRSKAFMVPNLGADENLVALPSRMRILRQLRRDGIEIIHTHTELPQGFTGRYCAKALGIPHVHTVHTMWIDYRHYLFRGRLLTERNIAFAYHIFLRKTTAVIAPSLKALHFLGHIDIQGVRINNGVDAELFFTKRNVAYQEQLRRQFGLQPDSEVIIFVGRLAPEKRAYELTQLLIEVLQVRKQAVAMLIGEGVDTVKMKELAHEAGLSERFIFAGRIAHEQMPNYYALASLYVTISLSEVQPMTLIEALLCGLPIIARNDIAYAELVEEGKNGSLHESDAEVRDAVLACLADKELLRRYSKRSFEIAQLFTAQMNAKQTLHLYELAIKAGRPELFHKGPLVNEL